MNLNRLIGTDNRDIRTTWLTHENHSTRTSVDPVDLFNNALINWGGAETPEQQEVLEGFVDHILTELIDYVGDIQSTEDDPWADSVQDRIEDFIRGLTVNNDVPR